MAFFLIEVDLSLFCYSGEGGIMFVCVRGSVEKLMGLFCLLGQLSIAGSVKLNENSPCM